MAPKLSTPNVSVSKKLIRGIALTMLTCAFLYGAIILAGSGFAGLQLSDALR